MSPAPNLFIFKTGFYHGVQADLYLKSLPNSRVTRVHHQPLKSWSVHFVPWANLGQTELAAQAQCRFPTEISLPLEKSGSHRTCATRLVQILIQISRAPEGLISDCQLNTLYKGFQYLAQTSSTNPNLHSSK